MATAEGTCSTVDPPDDSDVAVAADTLLDRLSDDHASQVLHALGVGPRSAAALTERLPVSRATIYRRLDDLVSAGLVESRLAIDGDGHHRNQFDLAVDAITVQFRCGGVSVDATAAEPPRTTPTTTVVDEPAVLLDALGDEYTRAVVAAMGEQSLAAREIVDRTGASRPTVYRRLNRLVDLGIVETIDSLGPSGQQRQQYRLTVTEIDISLIDGSAIDDDRSQLTTSAESHSEQKNTEHAREQRETTTNAAEQQTGEPSVAATETEAAADQPPDSESPIATPQ